VYNLIVPVETKESLVKYKKKIARRVDMKDVRAIENKKNTKK
jgi:hypothetical protein